MNRDSQETRRGARRTRRTRAAAAAAVLAAAALALSACGGGSDDAGGGKGGKKAASDAKDAAAKKTSVAAVDISAKNGSDSVKPDALKVTVSKGKLTSVQVQDEKGRAVSGAIAAGGASWAPKDNLATGTKYKVHAVAKDKDGLEAAEDSTFTTVTPAGTFLGTYTPEDGSKVGVGMPVSINFNKPIDASKKAEVQKHLTVEANPGVQIVGHWFGNQRIDFRPQNYWKSGTKVSLHMRLSGVEGEQGVYGTQNKDVSFTIGRNQVSIVDAAKHTMKVTQDGRTIKTIPISAGGPGHTTYNGKMVISEQERVTRMNGDTVGFGGEYDIKDVPHAQRLTTSGTFIHGNYWSGGAFGNYNASHGCVGLQDARGGSDSLPGGWFYNHSLIGDVVQVTKSPDKTVQPDNGLNGWNMDWADWVKGSAVPAGQ